MIASHHIGEPPRPFLLHQPLQSLERVMLELRQLSGQLNWWVCGAGEIRGTLFIGGQPPRKRNPARSPRIGSPVRGASYRAYELSPLAAISLAETGLIWELDHVRARPAQRARRGYRPPWPPPSTPTPRSSD